MLQSWWWCCVASTGLGLGRHSHSLALLGLALGAGASWFGAAPAELLSTLACSLPIYLAVYYLCRLQMPRSLICYLWYTCVLKKYYAKSGDNQ
jgi:predicted cobalt transporter CbtA